MIHCLAKLLVALAFVVTTTANAMPMLSMAKSESAIASVPHSFSPSACKDLAPGKGMKSNCVAMCAHVFALVPPFPTLQNADLQIALSLASELGDGLDIRPDTSPPRS